MGWFTKKCPYCGGPLEETGYSIGCAEYRCRNCIKRNREKREFEKRLVALENKLVKVQG